MILTLGGFFKQATQNLGVKTHRMIFRRVASGISHFLCLGCRVIRLGKIYPYRYPSVLQLMQIIMLRHVRRFKIILSQYFKFLSWNAMLTKHIDRACVPCKNGRSEFAFRKIFIQKTVIGLKARGALIAAGSN